MTTTQRLKDALITYLNLLAPSPSISVVDSKQRADIDLPTLAVEVGSVEPHSAALLYVQRAQVTIKLRLHAGDEDEADVDNWIDQIESLLNDPSAVEAASGDNLRMDYWIYSGSSQEWDESILEVSFEAESLITRI